MNIFEQITMQIITEQERIIGPLAWIEAQKVSGISIDSNKKLVIRDSNGSEVVNDLVARYERLFGRASHDVCKDAVSNLILNLPREQIPMSLR